MGKLTDELRAVFPRSKWTPIEYTVAEENAARLNLTGEQIRAAVRAYRAECDYSTPQIKALLKKLRACVPPPTPVSAQTKALRAPACEVDPAIIAWWKNCLRPENRRSTADFIRSHGALDYCVRARGHPNVSAALAHHIARQEGWSPTAETKLAAYDTLEKGAQEA